MTPKKVLEFWFNQLTPSDWWNGDKLLDEIIKNKFSLIHQKAIRQELDNWHNDIYGRLAEIIVLDQFSRHIYRDSFVAYAFDNLALLRSKQALMDDINLLNANELGFLLMPFMHSEDLKVHEEALILFNQPGLEKRLAYEKKHYDIIKKFGRYPFRNAILHRTSTEEEKEYMKKNKPF